MDAQSDLEATVGKVEVYERSMQDKNEELEHIRCKLTQVAELFERKPITHKYTFEVLLDFISDKARRLFAKFDSVIKEKKVMKEEKSYYYQRRVDQLEQQLQSCDAAVQFTDRVLEVIVPRMQALLESGGTRGKGVDQALEVLQQCESEFRTSKKQC